MDNKQTSCFTQGHYFCLAEGSRESKYKKFDVLFTLASLTFAVSKLCKTGRYPENVFAQFPWKRYLKDT